jgi:hypothetical protein
VAEQDPLKYFKGEIKRLNYYNSQFLVDTDFNDEQLYHKQMRRFHNRALHTWGVVEGLRVERVQNESKVTVSPGVAIDRLGQEIVLPKRSAAVGLDTFDAGAQVYVTVRYADVQDQADKDTSDRQARGERYKRWTERPEVSASATEPAADAPDVLLAVVKLDGNKAIAEVLLSKRRYAGSRIGSSDDGKEFAVYADAGGAWHFFDGGRGADRLTIDDKGNVGVGTPPSAARLSVLTNPGPYDGALMDFVVGGNYRLSLRSKAVANDTVAYFFDLVNNLGRFDNFLTFDRGNVGVGTAEPATRLHVKGVGDTEVSLESADNQRRWTLQATGAAEGTAPAGYFQIIDRTAGKSRLTINTGGNVGIGTTKPLGPLSVGDSSVMGSDGYIVIGKHVAGVNMRHFRIGFDDNLNFTIGDYGNNNTAGTWSSQFAIAWNAPSQSLFINSSGNVGIGTNDLGTSKLRIAKSATDFAHVRYSGTDTGMGEFEIVGWTSGWNINTRTAGKHLYLNRDANDSSDVLIGHSGREVTVKGNSGNVGIGAGGSDSFKLLIDTAGGTKTSLKCEHRGSNFIVRPESSGGNATVIENTGGGALFINPGGAKVSIGTLEVTGDITMGATKTLSSGDGRMHIFGGEILYLLNKKGVTIGKEWGGTGDLNVQGNVRVDGAISCGGKVGFRTYHGTYVNANADKTTMRQAGRLDIHEQFTLEMACSREFKENVADLTADEALTTLRHLNPVKYDYKGERTFRQNLGFIAEEMPDNLASADRKSISPFEVVPVLTRVLKLQQESLARLEATVRALQDEAGRGHQ